MKINIKTTNISLDRALEDWVHKKIGELERYLDKFESAEFLQGTETIEIWVEIGKTTKHHLKGDIFRAEAQFYLPGKKIRAEATDTDLRTAINQVKEELQRRIKSYKGKRISRARRWARKVKEFGRVHRFLRKENNKIFKIFKRRK
ncbi:ribosome-associated translation inhibitor RaiA [bacterium]|nr:ribosome-associated translation inhibitor RaiA [bacterium]